MLRQLLLLRLLHNQIFSGSHRLFAARLLPGLIRREAIGRFQFDISLHLAGHGNIQEDAFLLPPPRNFYFAGGRNMKTVRMVQLRDEAGVDYNRITIRSVGFI